MMIVVANLRLSGFFRMVTGWAAGRARHPVLLLSVVVITTGVPPSWSTTRSASSWHRS
jgi:Na+/H+ antiporter NhaD/arsenite permease-like protein